MGYRNTKLDHMVKVRTSIKGQTLRNFIDEFANASEIEEAIKLVKPPTWNLFVDGSSRKMDAKVSVVLVSPEGHKLNCVGRFDFKASNNAIEYEALLANLRIAIEIQVERLYISSDSQLVASQLNGNFTTKDKGMATYIKLVMDFVPSFKNSS